MSSLDLPVHSPPSPLPTPTTPSSSTSSSSPQQYRGWIDSVVSERGFAWIRCPQHGSSVFVHQSLVTEQQLLSVGDEVVFTIGHNSRARDPNRTQAENVRVVAFADPANRGRHWQKRTAFPAPPSPSPANGAGGGGLQHHCNTADYIWSLPRYGRVDRVQRADGVCTVVLTTLPLLSSEAPEQLHVELPAHTTFGKGELLTFHHLHPRTLHVPTDFSSISPASLPSFPSSHCNVANTLSAALLIRHPLRVDEDRHTEFKSLLQMRTHHVEERVAFLVEKNTSAFLNSDGGWLYVGVDDDGCVEGLWLDKRRRDELKRKVDAVMHGMSPAVDTQLYSLDFLPVHLAVHPLSDDASFHQVRAVPLPHLYVLVLRVERPAPNSAVYFTSGRNRDVDEKAFTSRAWLRRDGSVREMTAAMVVERMKAVQAREAERMKADILRDVMSALHEHERKDPAPVSAAAVTNEGEDERRAAITDQLLAMGMDRLLVLDAVEQAARDGKLRTAPGSSAGMERIISDILDRMSRAQADDRNEHGKEEAVRAAPPALSLSRAPANASPNVSPSVSPISSLYPTVSPTTAAVSADGVEGLGGSAASSMRVTYRVGGRGGGAERSADESDSIPCEFCRCAFPQWYVMEHQRSCTLRQRVRDTAATATSAAHLRQ